MRPKASGISKEFAGLSKRGKSSKTELTVPVQSDPDLVANIQNGRSEAETALYDRFSARVYYLALRESRSPQDAEDVRAETFLRVLQAIRGNNLRSPTSLPSFILGTARNVLHELFQRRKRAGKTTEPETVELASPSHEELFLDAEVRHAVKRAIDRLKPRERHLIRLHFYEELPTQEIARRTGIAPERVRLVKSRALKRFRDYYGHLSQARLAKKVDTQSR